MLTKREAKIEALIIVRRLIDEYDEYWDIYLKENAVKISDELDVISENLFNRYFKLKNYKH